MVIVLIPLATHVCTVQVMIRSMIHYQCWMLFSFNVGQVRMYGSFEQLTTAIKSYLQAEDPGKLFVKILERLEADFDHGAASRLV